MAQKKALGKGLGALIGTPKAGAGPHSTLQPDAVAPGEAVRKMPIGKIIPSPFQPRKQFREGPNLELVESIREHGVIQPLIVRERDGSYELIAGERRWRAANHLELKEVPVIVRDASDLEVLEMALIENLQREDLNPVEEAQAYERLGRDFDLTQEQIAKRVGKSRAAVANAIRLLDLNQEVQDWLVQGHLTVGHAKVLLAVSDRDQQRVLADQVIRQGKTVRETEALVKRYQQTLGGGSSSPATANGRKSSSSSSGSGNDLPVAVKHLQNRIREHLATDVQIQHSAKRGKIEISYYGNEDLERLCELLGVEVD